MESLKWRYYNHALLPTTAPHEKIDESVIKQGILWKKKWGGVPLLIRWTTDFDCPKETGWWYCIKDTPFDINSLKSKRRYEINKGKKNFYVKIINPSEYAEEIYQVYKESVNSYSKKSYKLDSKEKFIKNLLKQNSYIVFGAFQNENNNLASYALINKEDDFINFNVLKSIPRYEKYGVNATIVSYILESFNEELNNKIYICDGERNILHKTDFQDYLEKYFGFRKAFCKLNIEYRPEVKFMVNILYPFRNFIKCFGNVLIFNKINAILYMEEIRRSVK